MNDIKDSKDTEIIKVVSTIGLTLCKSKAITGFLRNGKQSTVKCGNCLHNP